MGAGLGWYTVLCEVVEENTMLQLKRILVPVDFSETARAALEFACELAASFQAQLHLVHLLLSPKSLAFAH